MPVGIPFLILAIALRHYCLNRRQVPGTVSETFGKGLNRVLSQIIVFFISELKLRRVKRIPALLWLSRVVKPCPQYSAYATVPRQIFPFFAFAL